jgi:hypothetical protein
MKITRVKKTSGVVFPVTNDVLYDVQEYMYKYTAYRTIVLIGLSNADLYVT